MSVLTIVTPLPYIDTDVVKKGLTAAYMQETALSEGFNGTVSDVKSEEVTLTGFRRSAAATVKLTAAQLKSGSYSAFKYAHDLTEIIGEGSGAWTKEENTEIIDPAVCRAGYFITYRRNAGDMYTNGLIVSVERDRMTVATAVSGKSVTAALTIADINKEGFEAEVSPEIMTGAGENYGTVEYMGG